MYSGESKGNIGNEKVNADLRFYILCVLSFIGLTTTFFPAGKVPLLKYFCKLVCVAIFTMCHIKGCSNTGIINQTMEKIKTFEFKFII